MAIYKQVSHSKLRGPDEFISTMDRVFHFLAKNKILVVLLILLSTGGGLFVLVSGHFDEKKNQKINAEVYLGMKSAEKTKALEGIVEKYSKNKVAELARIKLIGEYLGAGNLDKALDQADKSNLDGFFGSMIVWNKAQILWEQGKANEALQTLDSVLSAEGEDGALQDYLMFLKAEILWSQDKIADALALYDQLAHANEDADPQLVEMANARYLYLKSLVE